MQLGASEEFPSCGLSSTVNTHDEEDAAFPLAGAPASLLWAPEPGVEAPEDGGQWVASLRPGSAEGSAGSPIPKKRLSSRRCGALQKGNINIIIIILFI